MEPRLKEYKYVIRCRKCDKVSNQEYRTYDLDMFMEFIRVHKKQPIIADCSCMDNAHMLHDLVAYVNGMIY